MYWGWLTPVFERIAKMNVMHRLRVWKTKRDLKKGICPSCLKKTFRVSFSETLKNGDGTINPEAIRRKRICLNCPYEEFESVFFK